MTPRINIVSPGLVPGVHSTSIAESCEVTAWITGTSPVMTCEIKVAYFSHLSLRRIESCAARR